MARSDITVAILKDIRDEIRKTNKRLDTTNKRLDTTIKSLDVTNRRIHSTDKRLVTIESTLNHRLGAVETTLNHRLGAVETTLLELAEQQRFIVRYTKALSERDGRLEGRLTSLESRVGKLEAR